MRIGLLTPSLSLEHGTGHYSIELISHLRRVGIQVDVISSKDTPIIKELQPIHNILPLGDGANFVRLCAVAPRVSWILRNCDIIHSTVERYAILSACIAHRRPMFLTAHGSFVHVDDAWRWPLSKMYRWAFSKSVRVMCVSQFTALRAKTVMPGLRTEVIYSGISIERFNRLVRQQCKGPPTILCVAAIKRRQGIIHLVRAVAKVREYLPSVRCIVIGTYQYGPDYLADVRSEIAQLQLQDCVQLLGHVDEPILLQWYANADIFDLPAINDKWRFEGYGLAYLEAGAAGLPVIGTKDCGAENAIDHGITGLLVFQETLKDDLPKAILQLLLDSDARICMGQAGRKKAESQSWERCTTAMIDVYRSVITDHQ
jgi:glycosyltransferase involved in cell wall biosynthesis